MLVKIHPSWQEELNEEFEKPYFQKLISFVKNEYAANTCFPKGNEIFAAFDHCPFNKVKVVIIGIWLQDSCFIYDPHHVRRQIALKGYRGLMTLRQKVNGFFCH